MQEQDSVREKHFPLDYLSLLITKCKKAGAPLLHKLLQLPIRYLWARSHISNLPDLSVQFSYSVVSDFLRPHESQHARPPCPSPTPGVHPDPRPLSQ